MKLSVVDSWTGKRRTAEVDLSHTGVPIAGWWDDGEELTEDELVMITETYAEECQQWSDDCAAEEEWDRDRDR